MDVALEPAPDDIEALKAALSAAQAERYEREGVPLSLSTLADQVGAACVALAPLLRCVAAHVLAAERLHGDDTTVPVLAKGKTDIARCWTYVRDDRPFGGTDPPAAMFYYSRDRRGTHPQAHLKAWSGVLQADAYGGYGELCQADRQPGPVLEAACWAHGRRKFFELADIEAAARRKAEGRTPQVVAPLALEAVQRIDAIFAIERQINGLTAAERGIALGRKAGLFAGSDRGGERAAAMYSLIVTAKLNDVDPQAWLADVLARIAAHPASRIDQFLPWNWRTTADPKDIVA
jgi:transposase